MRHLRKSEVDVDPFQDRRHLLTEPRGYGPVSDLWRRLGDASGVILSQGFLGEMAVTRDRPPTD